MWWTACGQPTGALLLVSAAAVNDVDGVRQALDRGVPPDAVDSAGTALMLTDSVDVARLLLERGANPSSAVFDFTPLASATARRRLPLMDLLMDWGADPNQRTTGGKFPLDIAQLAGFADAEELLKARGAAASEECNETTSCEA